jgi:hypothetical protein
MLVLGYKLAFIILRYISSISGFIRALILKVCWILLKAVLHLLRWSSGFCLYFCQYGVLHLTICVCWNIPISLEWSLLDHGVWSFLCFWIQFAIILLRVLASKFIKEIDLWFALFVVSLLCFSMSVIMASFFSVSLENLRSPNISSSLKVW